MTKFQALFVAYLRLRCEGSWRWVAAKYEERYFQKISFNLLPVLNSNSIKGRDLCISASNVLNIQVD